MAHAEIESVVEEALSQVTGADPRDTQLTSGLSFSRFAKPIGSMILPPWWSMVRDSELREIWKANDHLSLAMYNAQAKIIGIPLHFEARDPHNSRHVAEAEETTRTLMQSIGFGEGWETQYGKAVEDFLDQDNGFFFEVIGNGPADGPIIGKPITLRHLDAAQCMRTSDPIFPVIFTDRLGARWRLHWTRVLYASQMSSARQDMNGVGFCAISRCVEVAQTLMDIVRYKQEQLGSRPLSQILVGKGIDGEQIIDVIEQLNSKLNDKGNVRYAGTGVLGDARNPDIGIDKIDLTTMGPFEEATSINLGMFAIASAFGMDADELWAVGGGSTSKGDANLRRMRTRGRLPSQVTAIFAEQLNFKFIPPYLRAVFDFKDDEEDQQRAIIRDIRERNRERGLGSGAIDIRTARINMLRDNDVDQTSFAMMEIKDGRLSDGSPIATLFFSDDPVYTRLLRFIDDPLVISAERAEEVIPEIQRQRQIVVREMAMTTSANLRPRITNSYWALDWLQDRYELAAGLLIPKIPIGSRNLRTDIRIDKPILPQEEQNLGEVQPDEENMGGDDG